MSQKKGYFDTNVPIPTYCTGHFDSNMLFQTLHNCAGHFDTNV